MLVFLSWQLKLPHQRDRQTDARAPSPSSVSMTSQETVATGSAPGDKQGAVWEKQGCGAASEGSRGGVGLNLSCCPPELSSRGGPGHHPLCGHRGRQGHESPGSKGALRGQEQCENNTPRWTRTGRGSCHPPTGSMLGWHSTFTRRHRRVLAAFPSVVQGLGIFWF